MALEISRDATLIVRAPNRLPETAIEAFINEKFLWIQKALAAAQVRPRARAKAFQEGERFLYQGTYYPLTYVAGRSKAVGFDGRFLISEMPASRARTLFIDWYRKSAKKIISERVHVYAERFDLHVRAIRITSARTRWGSASKRGVNFSWRLIMAPPDVIDYVVVHELAHLRHPNHGRGFWAEVARMYPGYEVPKRWLRTHGATLDL